MNKECIFESDIIITYSLVNSYEKLGNFKIVSNNTIINYIAKKRIESDNSYAEHVFTKFVNCTVGNTYLAVKIDNIRAINFFKKMRMIYVSRFFDELSNDIGIIYCYKKNRTFN